jgi:hypothetical protein
LNIEKVDDQQRFPLGAYGALMFAVSSLIGIALFVLLWLFFCAQQHLIKHARIQVSTVCPNALRRTDSLS